jgi:hypothetical protein
MKKLEAATADTEPTPLAEQAAAEAIAAEAEE